MVGKGTPKKSRKPKGLSTVHTRAAGVDVGSRFHVVAVPEDLCAEPVQTYQSFTGDLHRLGDWLEAVGITTVAMESTGIYWIPLFEILEARGLEVLLVNARDVKQVPGRKTDVNDAQWLQQLHQYGLLRGSFRPAQEVATLRAYLRHRERLLSYAAAHIQHMQKALMQMNLQLHHVLSDITGVTGMAIMRAIVAGNHDPRQLASLRDRRCKAPIETVEAALTGHYQPEHLFALRQAIELYDIYQAKMAECDKAIEAALARLHPVEGVLPDSSTRPKPPRRKRQTNEPGFDIHTAMLTLLGTDLTQIHGFAPYTVLRLVGECGTDMSRWPTAKHFTSWLTLCPGSKISGGKLLCSKTRRSTNRAATVFRMAALNVGKTSTALGAFYRRLAARAGRAKAITATARKLAVLFYNTLRYGIDYCDPGVDYYETQHRQRILNGLRRRAKALGYDISLAASPT